MFHKWIPGAADVDLLSIDIQRGRDIGLSAYTKVREICGFSSISSFDDLSDVLLDEVRILNFPLFLLFEFKIITEIRIHDNMFYEMGILLYIYN